VRFALLGVNGEKDEEPCYLAVRPVGDCKKHKIKG